jgi:hypothetical protein
MHTFMSSNKYLTVFLVAASILITRSAYGNDGNDDKEKTQTTPVMTITAIEINGKAATQTPDRTVAVDNPYHLGGRYLRLFEPVRSCLRSRIAQSH